jgi:YidC/Oxa1 family membrane protein insertase
VLAVALVAIVCVMHVVAQRQEVAQLPMTGALSGPVEQRRGVLLPALLLVIGAVSLVLPLGVLIFWATSKVWTVGQQRVLKDYPGSG